MSFTTKVQYDLQLWFIAIGDRKKKRRRRRRRRRRRDAPERKGRGFVYEAFLPSQIENHAWRLKEHV